MFPKTKFIAGLCGLALVLAAAPRSARAQGSGPMQPPESTKFPTPPPAAKPESPTLPPEEIIRRFAAKEDEMVRAIKGYTFQKEVRIEEIGPNNKSAGQLDIVTQVRVSPEGKMSEKPVSRQPSTLHYLDLHRGDSDLLAPTPMFPLTTAMLPKYQIIYGGKQPLDELTAYYFTIKPRAVDRAYAYFSGVVWVDIQDLVIVKTMGKWVTELGDVTASDLPFTVFETYRQQVGKDLWFPAYSRSDETIQSGDVSVPLRVIVKWSDFKPAGSDSNADVPGPPMMKPPDNPGKP
ncbi:MAG TPA: hypothetical protein VKT71_08605 [Candidatus Acidoferrales bacterium]|nr:hypothetical protein [Candidatus Acidoferrales bacterium]